MGNYGQGSDRDQSRGVSWLATLVDKCTGRSKSVVNLVGWHDTVVFSRRCSSSDTGRSSHRCDSDTTRSGATVH